MTISIISKTTAQKIPSQDISGNTGALVGGTPVTVYTVPAGLKAIVVGTVTTRSFGSGGEVNLRYATVPVANGQALDVPSNTVTHVIEAGQTVDVLQVAPAGGNADYKLTVTESPA